MKLARPFCRLPVRFDAARLRAEVESLPADAWSHHPKEHEGNTALRLITVGGGPNDAVAGEMKPTPALLASPYLQQVLASFGTVWSRSRLMRIAGGASVPQHSDINYHWFHRVRLHIPVVTRPEVRFHCADESVHMAAGEAWIFDNWREHRVENPAEDARVHLVADTAGTSAFWRLAAQGQVDRFDGEAREARLVAFDPAARPQLMVERFNAPPVMPASEVEQLAFDLLADLAPADARPESAAAVRQLVGLMVEFCHDWRSLWSLHGDAPAGRRAFRQLIALARGKLAQVAPVRVASTGYSAHAVLNARLLAHLFGNGGMARPEAAEFNAAAAATPSPAPAEVAGEEPTLSELPTVEVPHVELPTVEVPRISTVVLERPPGPEREPEPEPEPEQGPGSRPCSTRQSSS